MPKQKDWSRFHERNILRESAGSYDNLTAGQIVRFNYTGQRSTVKRPLVLILNPRWHNKMHAISLDYISDDVLMKLKNIVQETLQARVQQLTRLRLPLLKADIKDPQQFYERRLKPFIKTFFNPNESPYRQYIVQNIRGLRFIDYRFKDFYDASTGERDEVAGKTRER